MRELPKVGAAVAIPLIWSNWLLPRSGRGLRGRTVANAVFATGYAVALRGRPNWWSSRGLTCGLASGAVVLSGYGAALAIPAVRARLSGFADRGPGVATAEWVAVHIPVGTVYSEELIFRATLDPLLDNAFGPRLGSALGAAIFGLWHIRPARAAGDDIATTVIATGFGGLVLGRLGRRATSATAPALFHFALNAGGALAPRLARSLPRPPHSA